MGSRHVVRLDADTGEILPGVVVYLPHRPRHTERFLMTFQDALIEIAKDRELTLEPKNVLMFLLGKLDFENFIHVSQKDIVVALGIDKANVSKAMKLLIAKGIILSGPKVGRVHTYRLSPDLGWKGRVVNLEKYRRAQLTVITGGKNTGNDSGDSGDT